MEESYRLFFPCFPDHFDLLGVPLAFWFFVLSHGTCNHACTLRAERDTERDTHKEKEGGEGGGEREREIFSVCTICVRICICVCVGTCHITGLRKYCGSICLIGQSHAQY